MLQSALLGTRVKRFLKKVVISLLTILKKDTIVYID